MTGEDTASTGIRPAADRAKRRTAARKRPNSAGPQVIPTNWRELQTVTVQVYAAIIGVAKNTAYQACARGDVATIRLGGRVLVCVPALMRQLNGDERHQVSRTRMSQRTENNP